MIRFTVNKRGKRYRLEIEDTDTQDSVCLMESSTGADRLFAAAEVMEKAFGKAQAVSEGGREQKVRRPRKSREPKPETDPASNPKPKAKRLTQEQKEAIDQMVEDGTGWTNEAIAEKLGVEVSQVKRYLDKLEKAKG